MNSLHLVQYTVKKNILLVFAYQHISNKTKNTSTVHSIKASAPPTVSSSCENKCDRMGKKE
jgi:hypothetical protein